MGGREGEEDSMMDDEEEQECKQMAAEKQLESAITVYLRRVCGQQDITPMIKVSTHPSQTVSHAYNMHIVSVSSLVSDISTGCQVLQPSCVHRGQDPTSLCRLHGGVCQGGMGTVHTNTAHDHQLQRECLQSRPPQTVL